MDMELFAQSLNNFATTILIVMGVSLSLSLLLLVWIVWQIKKIDLPPDADFKTALLSTPLTVVLMLDLLDLGLDFLSAPVGWAILTYLGLRPLRGVTAVEGLIPGTQLLPTMTASWVTVRLFKNRL